MSRVLAYNPVPNAVDGKTMKDIQQEANPEEGLDTPLLGVEKNDDDNPVIHAAYIHILGDMIQSCGVLLAACIIYFFQNGNPGIRIVDPICTFVFAIIVLCTTGPVSKNCLNVLMEAAPDNINAPRLYEDLQKVIGVVNVHDIHIWCISIGRPSISLHILSDSRRNRSNRRLLSVKNTVFSISRFRLRITQIKRLSYIKCTHEGDNDIH